MSEPSGYGHAKGLARKYGTKRDPGLLFFLEPEPKDEVKAKKEEKEKQNKEHSSIGNRKSAIALCGTGFQPV